MDTPTHPHAKTHTLTMTDRYAARQADKQTDIYTHARTYNADERMLGHAHEKSRQQQDCHQIRNRCVSYEERDHVHGTAAVQPTGVVDVKACRLVGLVVNPYSPDVADHIIN